MRKYGGDCLEKEMIEGTLQGKQARGRPRTTWLRAGVGNVKTSVGLSLE